RSLLVLDAGIAVLHGAITALFVVLPFVLARYLKTTQLWMVYSPVLAVGFGAMVWASRSADKRTHPRLILALGAGPLTVGLVGLALFRARLAGVAVSLAAFVMGFAMIEPLLASLLTRTTGRGARGTAAGLFNMAQFTGAFLGGAAAGLLMHYGVALP